MTDIFAGKFVSWPNTYEQEQHADFERYAGWGRVIATVSPPGMRTTLLVATMIYDDDEPGFQMLITLDNDLRFFDTVEEMKKWLAWWRKDEDNEPPKPKLVNLHPKGNA